MQPRARLIADLCTYLNSMSNKVQTPERHAAVILIGHLVHEANIWAIINQIVTQKLERPASCMRRKK